MSEGIYHRLGTKPVINGLGVYTDLGGSRLSPTVWAAMEEANRTFARMPELLETSGRIVAGLLGSEAARVTPGASSAIAMAIAACMTGTDARKTEQLPDVTGMPAQVLIQRRHRYKYDRMVRMTGAQLIEVGNVNGTEPQELEAALSEQTAAIFVPAHLDSIEGTVPLEIVATIAHTAEIPAVVDAAYLNFPVELMSSFTRRGADLAIFSAKYFSGPNTGGVICGRRDLIEAVAGVDFTRFEASKYLAFGRPFKLDRQLVVGVVEALREWLTLDHGQRFAEYQAAVRTIAGFLEDVGGLELTPMSFTMAEALEPEPVNCLRVRPLARPELAAQVVGNLAAGDPSILVHEMNGAIVADVECVTVEEAEMIGKRLHEELVVFG
jgi:D-glucosaminate-6-phosphate ammonia-lyase